jgi:hypothetical protein
MRIVLILFFLVFPLLVSADTPAVITGLMKRLNLQLVAKGEPLVYPGVSEIYRKKHDEKFALVILNADGEINRNILIDANTYIILNIPSDKEGVFHSIALSGYSKRYVESLFSVSMRVKPRWSFSLFSAAYADEGCQPQILPESSLSSLGELENVTDRSYLEMAQGCVLSAVQGAWSTTGGMAANAWRGFRSLLTEPRAFWDRRVEDFRAIRQFMAEFDSRIQEMAISLKELPADVLAEMLCGFIGGAAGAALLGGGLVRLAPHMTQFINRLAGLSVAFSTLNRLGTIRSIPTSFYHRLANGEISPERLNSIRTFGENGMGRMIHGAMACGL